MIWYAVDFKEAFGKRWELLGYCFLANVYSLHFDGFFIGENNEFNSMGKPAFAEFSCLLGPRHDSMSQQSIRLKHCMTEHHITTSNKFCQSPTCLFFLPPMSNSI